MDGAPSVLLTLDQKMLWFAAFETYLPAHVTVRHGYRCLPGSLVHRRIK
jgi:hypothetical protein